jgi:hypothetical protein
MVGANFGPRGYRHIAAICIASVGCTGDIGGTGGDRDLSCDAIPDPHCAHPIDRLLVPRLRRLGLEPRDAGGEELLRRMALDLIGRGPTVSEQAALSGLSPGEMFDALIADPDYIRTQRRAWGELFTYDPIVTWTDDIVELDNLVSQLYSGDLSYADFVTAAIMHPATEALHPGDSWTTAVFSIFLGRTAREDEIAALRPLTAMWRQRNFCAMDAWWNEYQRRLNDDPPATEPEAIAAADMSCVNSSKPEWRINTCLCTPRDGFPGCNTNALGTPISITPVCVDTGNLGAEANEVRAVAYTPGSDSMCPDGSSRPECADRRIVDYATFTLGPYVTAPAMSAQTRAEIDGIGRAFVARGDLWEAAIDREARRMLAWWQATFRHPDSDLPDIRTLLADTLREGATVIELQRLIMTSQLYVQPAATPMRWLVGEIDGDSMPPWTAGPTKLLSGESWLETVGQAVDLIPQRCDFRWISLGGLSTYSVDPRLIETRVSSLDERYYNGFSANTITRLSGCNSELKRPEVSNIGLAFNQNDIARFMCAYGNEVTPAGWSGDLGEAATNLIARIWARTPRDGEVDAMVADMNACIAAGPDAGCEDPGGASEDIAARWLCRRMIDSVEFTTY